MTKALFNEQHQTASLKPITMLQFLILITFSFKSTLQTEIILLALFYKQKGLQRLIYFLLASGKKFLTTFEKKFFVDARLGSKYSFCQKNVILTQLVIL